MACSRVNFAFINTVNYETVDNKVRGQTGKQFLFLACMHAAIYSTYSQFRTDFIGNKMYVAQTEHSVGRLKC